MSFFVFVGALMTLFGSIEVDGRGSCRIEGVDYVAVGFGTYPFRGKVCVDAVEQAVKAGYRIIDTATYYENFEAIAEVIKKQKREQFYIISKVWRDEHAPADVRKDLDFTLTQLGTDYLDAYLLHWPNSEIPIEETLAAMEELRRAKKIRHIGLSNVTVNHLKRALEIGVPIKWIQVEMSPFFYDPELLEFCRKKSIVVQAWGPLGRGRIHQASVLEKIGKKHGKTASQVAIRWIVQHGCIPLPGSKEERHIQENIAIRDFSLSPEEMEEINVKARAGKRQRMVKEAVGFSDEFDFSYEECWPNRKKSP